MQDEHTGLGWAWHRPGFTNKPRSDIDKLQQNSQEPTPQDIDSLIAKEMTQLSMKEREQALHGIHGIPAAVVEDPEMMKSALNELDACIDSIKLGTTYELAQAISRSYVTNRQFRITFLRADRYRVKEAAARMIRFFDFKQSLFGIKKLVKEITLDDFDEDDWDLLKSGCVQISPYKDSAGRHIVLLLPKYRNYKVPENYMRVCFYVYMLLMTSKEAQTLGLAIVSYHIGATDTKSLNSQLRASLPIHVTSIHVCYDNPEEFAKLCKGIASLNTRSRVRMRLHYGSDTECLYQLLTFGIPRKAIPVADNGQLLTAEHHEWVEARLSAETDGLILSMDSSTPNIIVSATMMPTTITDGTVIVTPTLNDVVFGRGSFARQHPGNKKFRALIDRHMPQYMDGCKYQKKCISDDVVKLVKEHAGGRFLKPTTADSTAPSVTKQNTENVWEEVSAIEAHDKVAHAFRNRRKLFR